MEIIETYHPELIYYDFDLQKPEYAKYRRKMLVEYYNMEKNARELNGVVCCYKYNAFENGEAVLDVERGALYKGNTLADRHFRWHKILGLYKK